MIQVKKPTSKFVKVSCPKCKNEQVIFSKSATSVKCLVCEEILCTPTGGQADIKATVLEILE